MKKIKRFLKKNWGQIAILAGLLVLLVMVLMPLYLLIVKSFKTPSDDMSNPYGWPKVFFFENYRIAWEYIKSSYINSLVVTISVSLGTAAVASMAAFAFSRYRFPGKRILFLGLLGLMMVPSLLTLISRYDLVVRLHLINNLWGVILPAISCSLPFSIFLLTTFFEKLPKEMFEAAETDGASEFTIFYKFVLPLSKPVITTILLTTFVSQWNDYLWSKLVLVKESIQTLPVTLVGITDYLGESLSYAIPFAGYVLSAIPLVLIFAIGSKQFIEGLTSGAFKM